MNRSILNLQVIVLASVVVVVLSVALLLVGLVFNWQGYHLQLAAAQAKNTTTTTTNGAATIQLSAKELTSGVYRWTNSTTGGTFNPSLKVFANANNIIKIQNPTDTKHELIIDTGADVLPSSDDVVPHGSGQLSFTPTSTGTFTYHCAYHPFTMNGIVKVVVKP
ncbi:MAG: cupredoxin domain-containing protein [Nitrososphaeraceae archaeon]